MKIVLAMDQAEERSQLELALQIHYQVASSGQFQEAISLVERTVTDVVIFDLLAGDLDAPWFVETCGDAQPSAEGMPKFVCLVELPLVAGSAAVDWLRLLSYDDNVSVMVKPISHEALLAHLRSLAESDAQPAALRRYDRKHHELESRISDLDATVNDFKKTMANIQEHLYELDGKI
jgi:DNA-binding response OmpR family regulator